MTSEERAVLARIWEASGRRPLVPFVDQEVATAERELDAAIPDVVLAFLAATHRTVRAVVEATGAFDGYGTATWGEDAVRDTPLVFETWGDWPTWAGGFEATDDPHKAAMVVWDCKKWTPVQIGGGDFVSYARYRFGHFSGLDDGDIYAGHGGDERSRPGPPIDVLIPPSSEALAAFTPEIVGPPPPREHHVRHAKFGVGRVRKELGDRLEIDFGSHGIRLLLARFVVDAQADVAEFSGAASKDVAVDVAADVAVNVAANVAAVDEEIESPLLRRYLAGEHEAVWRELVDSRASGPEARAVARAIMVRVRENLNVLVERWRAFGFALPDPIGTPGGQREAIETVEARLGPLPETLRAFYLEIGHVTFGEPPPSNDWPDKDEFDPLQIWDLTQQLDELLDEDEPRLVLCADPLGVGPIYVPVPAVGFDAPLWFEE